MSLTDTDNSNDKRKKRSHQQIGDNTLDGITKKPTPSLDKLLQEVHKLLAAGVATFIPKACQALRQDWVPSMSDTVLKQNPGLQEEMRNRILKAFAKEWNEDGVWRTSSIEAYFEDFLRYKENQDANKENSKKGREAIQYRKNLQASGIDQDFRKIIRKSPEPPIEYEQEDEAEAIYAEGTGKIHEPETKALPSPIALYEEGVKSSAKLWKALTSHDLIAAPTVDYLVEHIKPTRDYRLRLFKGLDAERFAHYKMILLWMHELILDSLKTCNEINKENDKTEITR